MNRSDIRNARRFGITADSIGRACDYRCPDNCDADTWFEPMPDRPGSYRMSIGHERDCPQNILNAVGVG